MSEFAKCPNCGASNAKKISFTWWGGVLGPGLINHVKCQACGTAYNGKSGKSNTPAIIIYLVVSSVIAIGLVWYISNL